jgi:hypothetical protein
MILDISDPASPVLVSRTHFAEGVVLDLAHKGDLLYLCAGIGPDAVFRIVDVSAPEQPFIAGDYAIPNGAFGLDVADTIAYVTVRSMPDGEPAVYLLDINEPAHVDLISFVQTDHELNRIRVRGSLAHAGGGGGLYTVDISDPLNPVILSQFGSGGSYIPVELGFGVDDTLVYVADRGGVWPITSSAFSAYNVSDPANPSLSGRHFLWGDALDVEVVENIAYVGNGTCGLRVFDVYDPAEPVNVGLYQAPWDLANDVSSSAGNVAIQGDILILADVGPYMDPEAWNCDPPIPEPGDPSPGDLIILDISVPTEPIVLGFYTPSEPTDVDDKDDAESLPTEFVLYQNYPNPFNPSTHVDFTLARRELVVVDVYNALGQKIRTLKSAVMPAGEYSLEWDGRTDAGLPVASGVYLCRLVAGDAVESRKMALVR